MKKMTVATGIVFFGLSLFLAGNLFPAPKENRGKGKGSGKSKTTGSQTLIVEPNTMTSPVNTESSMKVCGSGFADGNILVVNVPWMGNPDSFSVISYTSFIDSSGKFCVSAPPDWTEMRLESGTYSIRTNFFRDSQDYTLKKGPTTTFQIMSK